LLTENTNELGNFSLVVDLGTFCGGILTRVSDTPTRIHPVNRGILVILRNCVIPLEFDTRINIMLWNTYRNEFIDVLRFKGRNLDRPLRFSILILQLNFLIK
jgi:hypothetical protein